MSGGDVGAEETVLLVVVEPGLDPAAPGAAALGAEAARLSGALGSAVRAVTWPAGSPAGVEAVAGALAEVVRAAQPEAVLLLDTDLGRQLAPMIAHRCGGGAIVGCTDVTVLDASGAGGDAAKARRLSFSRPAFGGWLQRDLTADDGRVPVAALDLAGVDAGADAASVLAAPEVVEPDATESTVRHLETQAPDARSVDLVHARRIVTAGVGAAGDELLGTVPRARRPPRGVGRRYAAGDR